MGLREILTPLVCAALPAAASDEAFDHSKLHHHGEAGTVFLLDDIVADDRTRTVGISDDGEYCLEVRNPDNRPSGFDLRLH